MSEGGEKRERLHTALCRAFLVAFIVGAIWWISALFGGPVNPWSIVIILAANWIGDVGRLQ